MTKYKFYISNSYIGTEYSEIIENVYFSWETDKNEKNFYV